MGQVILRKNMTIVTNGPKWNESTYIAGRGDSCCSLVTSARPHLGPSQKLGHLRGWKSFMLFFFYKCSRKCISVFNTYLPTYLMYSKPHTNYFTGSFMLSCYFKQLLESDFHAALLVHLTMIITLVHFIFLHSSTVLRLHCA